MDSKISFEKRRIRYGRMGENRSRSCKTLQSERPRDKTNEIFQTRRTFLVKRFDRFGKKRIHFMSAMTALGKKDGDNATGGISYLDIAAFISANGANPREDLTELWKRIVF